MGSDIPDSNVVTRAIIVETTTDKAKELKNRCMEKLAPQANNLISGAQVFVPFGSIDSFDSMIREKWIKCQTIFLKTTMATPLLAFDKAKQAHIEDGSKTNPR